MERLNGLFKALGEPNRFNIFHQLCGRQSANVKEVASCCNVDLSVVSRHLKGLKEAGVLDARKEGKEVIYSLRGRETAALLRELADQIDRCCNDDLNKQEVP